MARRKSFVERRCEIENFRAGGNKIKMLMQTPVNQFVFGGDMNRQPAIL